MGSSFCVQSAGWCLCSRTADNIAMLSRKDSNTNNQQDDWRLSCCPEKVGRIRDPGNAHRGETPHPSSQPPLQGQERVKKSPWRAQTQVLLGRRKYALPGWGEAESRARAADTTAVSETDFSGATLPTFDTECLDEQRESAPVAARAQLDVAELPVLALSDREKSSILPAGSRAGSHNI
jgi:hypothetical protein